MLPERRRRREQALVPLLVSVLGLGLVVALCVIAGLRTSLRPELVSKEELVLEETANEDPAHAQAAARLAEEAHRFVSAAHPVHVER